MSDYFLSTTNTVIIIAVSAVCMAGLIIAFKGVAKRRGEKGGPMFKCCKCGISWTAAELSKMNPKVTTRRIASRTVAFRVIESHLLACPRCNSKNLVKEG